MIDESAHRRIRGGAQILVANNDGSRSQGRNVSKLFPNEAVDECPVFGQAQSLLSRGPMTFDSANASVVARVDRLTIRTELEVPDIAKMCAHRPVVFAGGAKECMLFSKRGHMGERR